jgi:glycosyltransferase involved in cell wall biosynthesis
VIFTAPPRLDICWRLLPRLADAFLFISNYSRDRFSFRFRPDPAIPLVVTHLSLDRDEMTRGCTRAVRSAVSGAGPAEEPYILIFGNGYDHKGLDPAVAVLSDAFPYTRIVAIGAERANSPQVTALPSGRISEAEVDVLMADAAVVVFPSYYEGFGLPVVHGLANGRTVLVRNSSLWNEIANHADLPGTLIAFEDEISLVEAVGSALHGAPLAGLAMGGALAGGTGDSWSDCARPIMDLVATLATMRDASGWIERQSILSQLSPAARGG